MSPQHRVRQSSAPSHSRSSETCLKPLRYKSDKMQPRLPCKRKKRKNKRTNTHTHTNTQHKNKQSIYKVEDDGDGKNREQNRMRNPKEGKKNTKNTKTTNDQTDKTLQKLPQQNSQLLEFTKGNDAECAVKITRICNEAGRDIIASEKKFDLVSFVFFLVVFFNLSFALLLLLLLLLSFFFGSFETKKKGERKIRLKKSSCRHQQRTYFLGVRSFLFFSYFFYIHQTSTFLLSEAYTANIGQMGFEDYHEPKAIRVLIGEG